MFSEAWPSPFFRLRRRGDKSKDKNANKENQLPKLYSHFVRPIALPVEDGTDRVCAKVLAAKNFKIQIFPVFYN